MFYLWQIPSATEKSNVLVGEKIGSISNRLDGMRSPRGVLLKNWAGVCGPLPKTLTLNMIKICDFPYLGDLTKNLIPYLWPDTY